MVKVLLYHLISDLDHRMAVLQGHFEQHLETLSSAGYEFVPLADQLREGTSSKHKLSITFDDGYRNTPSIALESLVPALLKDRQLGQIRIVTGPYLKPQTLQRVTEAAAQDARITVTAYAPDLRDWMRE